MLKHLQTSMCSVETPNNYNHSAWVKRQFGQQSFWAVLKWSKNFACQIMGATPWHDWCWQNDTQFAGLHARSLVAAATRDAIWQCIDLVEVPSVGLWSWHIWRPLCQGCHCRCCAANVHKITYICSYYVAYIVQCSSVNLWMFWCKDIMHMFEDIVVSTTYTINSVMFLDWHCIAMHDMQTESCNTCTCHVIMAHAACSTSRDSNVTACRKHVSFLTHLFSSTLLNSVSCHKVERQHLYELF